MSCNKQTERNVAVSLIAMMVLASGLALTAWAKNPGGGKPDKPRGGGDPSRYTAVDLNIGIGDINDAGQVVGSRENEACILTPGLDLTGGPDGGPDGVPDTWFVTDLGTLDGNLRSTAGSVNESGQAVEFSWGGMSLTTPLCGRI